MSIGQMIRRAFMPKPAAAAPEPKPSPGPGWQYETESDDAFRLRIIRRVHLIAEQSRYTTGDSLDNVARLINMKRGERSLREPRG